MITTDATVLMRNSDDKKASENHKKKLQKYKKNPNKKLMNT